MGVEPVIDISKVNEEREREGTRGGERRGGERGGGREAKAEGQEREMERKTRGARVVERGEGGRGRPRAREKDKDGRRRRHGKGGVKGCRRGGELETEREIDVEGLSTTDKYYIRTRPARRKYWCNVCTGCERVSDILIPPLCIPTSHLSTPPTIHPPRFSLG